MSKSATPKIIFSLAAFLGSFLLFQLELMTGRAVLPAFGGSYYVWTVCLLFYQAALVAGYGYALLLSERMPAKKLLPLHLLLLGTALALMPNSLPGNFLGDPALDLLLRLAVMIGPPFLMLSASTTLAHRLLSETTGRDAFGVFAWSNAGSLAGMLSYSLLLEPSLPLPAVSALWRAAFIVYGLLFAGALAFRYRAEPPGPPRASEEKPRYFLWFILPAGTSALLAAVTSFQGSVSASMPLTWMIPLGLYLLSYALLFSFREIRLNTLRVSLFALLGVIAFLLWRANSPLTTALLALLNWALFFSCLAAHRELYAARPRSAALAPRYYLLMGLGGVAGTAAVTPVGALRLSFGFVDLYAALLILAAGIAYAAGRRPARTMLLTVGVLCVTFFTGMKLSGEKPVFGLRNFYGVYRVEDDTELGLRRFVHGSTVHGIQRLKPGEERQATVYYAAGSPISEVLRDFPAEQVGAVGLGVGVSCADAKKGADWTFYELDPDVVTIAREYFSFLPDCRAGVRVVTGDARIRLAEEPDGRFDILYLDAFTGGSVPLHLLTREALELYKAKLRPGGLMVFHVSANFLDIAPVIALSASAAGLQGLYKQVSFDPSDPARLSSEWLAVTASPAHLARLRRSGWVQPEIRPGRRAWSDDSSDILEALKW